MVVEEKPDLLSSLTRISNSEEIRNHERSILKKYAKVMSNRFNYLVNRQKAAQQPSFDNLFASFKNKDN
jgi:hypothetical protein